MRYLSRFWHNPLFGVIPQALHSECAGGHIDYRIPKALQRQDYGCGKIETKVHLGWPNDSVDPIDGRWYPGDDESNEEE